MIVVNILGFMLQFGSVGSYKEVHQLCEMFSDQTGYRFCPGIKWDFYEDRVIRYHLKSVRYSTTPYRCVDSVNCLLRFKLPKNAPLTDKLAKEVMCSFYKRLKTDLDWQRFRTMNESPS